MIQAGQFHRDEWVFPLDGLPLNESAVALFAERVRQIGQDVAIASEPAATVCQLVEGMPLAIELAAGWTQFMTLAQVVAQLQGGPPVFATHRRDVLDRHRSLEALFESVVAVADGASASLLDAAWGVSERL